MIPRFDKGFSSKLKIDEFFIIRIGTQSDNRHNAQGNFKPTESSRNGFELCSAIPFDPNKSHYQNYDFITVSLIFQIL